MSDVQCRGSNLGVSAQVTIFSDSAGNTTTRVTEIIWKKYNLELLFSFLLKLKTMVQTEALKWVTNQWSHKL